MTRCLSPLLVLVCIAFIGTVLKAQTNNVANNPYSQVSIASPTAGSLGKYADIPVNYHTGIPQINIPIYTVKAGSLTLPISLSYHASGLKVMEPASWVGAGWALNAGGVITRTVVGAPDERGTNNAGTESNGYYSDYGYNNYLYQSQTYGNPPAGSTTPQDWQAFANGWKDGEPDLYFFNFNNYTGKFYFNDDHTPVIVPEQDLKIVPTYTGSGSIQGFVITTPDGVQYSFGNIGGATNCTELTNPVTAQNGSSTGTAISSWYLNKIVPADNSTSISLSYTAENYGYFTIAMFPVDGTAVGPDGYGYNLVKNVVQGARLNQITFPNGTVTFNAAGSSNPGVVRTDLSDASAVLADPVNTQATTLGNIQIKDAGTYCKQFNFSYSYFTDNTSLTGFGTYTLQTDQYRLKLDKVQEVSCDNSTTVPPYQFTYFSEMVPRRLSFGQDHWGFYNGITNNAGLIPTYTVFGSNNYTQTYTGATRDPSWPAMRGGTLQQMTYPTGGYTSFDYGYNDTYTSYTVYQEVTMCSLVAHEYGQSALSQTLSFTATGGGLWEIVVHNTSTNYSPTLTITNSSNQQVYNSGFINVSSTLDITSSYPDGTYTATLSFPPNSGGSLINGADAEFYQYRYSTVSGNKMIGGLHINTITHNDGITSNNIVTSYNYQTNGQSNSILYSRPAYVGIVRNTLIANLGYWTPNNGFQPTPLITGGCTTTPDASYFKSPVSIRPMGTTQGYPIGYSRVTVNQTGNGSSIYDYWGSYNGNYASNTSDVAVTTLNKAGCDASQPNYPSAPLPFEFIRGELKHEWHYDQSGNLLQDVAYTPTYTNITATTPGFIVVWRGGQLLGTFYNLVNARKAQMVTVKTDYTPGVGSVMTTTTDTYGSAFHHGVTSHTVLTSANDNMASIVKYAWDFRVAACDAIADGWSTYTSTCASCQTTFNTASGQCNNNSSCITTAYLKYMQCTDAARVNYVTYRWNNFTNPSGNQFQSYHTAAENGADAELKPILLLQDEYKNPVIETSSYKNNNLINASFNRFDYGLNSSAFVYPNKLQTLFPTTLASTFANATVSGSSISKDSRYTDEAFYKFNGGNPVEATGKDGVTTSYLWGYGNVLPIAKAVGTDYATLSAAYTAAGSSLTSLRNQSSISGAQLSTYTYSPLLGITGQTDASGKTVTYEYDKLGRLVVIRDQWGNVVKKYDYQYINTGQ